MSDDKELTDEEAKAKAKAEEIVKEIFKEIFTVKVKTVYYTLKILFFATSITILFLMFKVIMWSVA